CLDSHRRTSNSGYRKANCWRQGVDDLVARVFVGLGIELPVLNEIVLVEFLRGPNGKLESPARLAEACFRINTYRAFEAVLRMASVGPTLRTQRTWRRLKCPGLDAVGSEFTASLVDKLAPIVVLRQRVGADQRWT